MEGTPGKNRYGDDPKRTGSREDFNRDKSVAITLIVSSFVWFFYLLVSTVFNWNMFYWDILLIPISLAVVGFLLLHEGKFTNHVAYALIIASVVWFIFGFNIGRWRFNIDEMGFGVYLITSSLSLITPAALLILAVSILERRDNRFSVSVLLITGSCISLIIHILIVFNSHAFGEAENLLWLMSSAAYVVVPVGFLILASYLLHNRREMLKSENAAYVQTPQAVAPQKKNTWQQVSPNNGGKVYYERDNKGMRVETSGQSMIYWTVERVKNPCKDPFVYYSFKNEYDARAALLGLPFIHVAADTGMLICDELFRYGYYAATNNGQLTGEYDAFIAGAGFTHDMWKQTHLAFARHNGVKKNDLEPERKAAASAQPAAGNAKNVTFVREDRDSDTVWIVYKAPCKADATAFLSRQQILRPLYYVVVETPEGNFGRDKDGFYQE
jgi:hypothetical protein